MTITECVSQVKDLLWNSDSSVLAVWLEDMTAGEDGQINTCSEFRSICFSQSGSLSICWSVTLEQGGSNSRTSFHVAPQELWKNIIRLLYGYMPIYRSTLPINYMSHNASQIWFSFSEFDFSFFKMSPFFTFSLFFWKSHCDILTEETSNDLP